jgi:hypothetical protein
VCSTNLKVMCRTPLAMQMITDVTVNCTHSSHANIDHALYHACLCDVTKLTASLLLLPLLLLVLPQHDYCRTFLMVTHGLVACSHRLMVRAKRAAQRQLMLTMLST